MGKSIKNLRMTVLILVTLLFSTVVYAAEIPAATDEFYVNDFADVFASEEEERLLANAVTLAEESDGIQVVVTTVESLEGDSIENYALEMYNQYEIGRNDMGLLILLSTGDRQIRVEVGRAMEAYINDSKAGRFMDEYAIPYLSENRFNEGLINLQEALIDEIVATVETESAQPIQDSETTNLTMVDVFRGILIASLLAMIILAVIILVRRMVVISRKKQHEIDSLHQQLEQANEGFERDKLFFQQKINDLQGKNDVLNNAYNLLKKKYLTLKDWHERVKVLYPDADQKVSNMIKEEIRQKNMILAKRVDENIGLVINLKPSKDIVQRVERALQSYLALNESQKLFIESDINRLKKLYDESVELKNEYDRIQEEKRRKKAASNALSSINSIIASITIGRSMHLSKLKDAMSIYNNLDAGSKEFFDKSTLGRLNKLYRDAKRDKEEEEAERQRRKSWEEKSFIHKSSSSHSGFTSSHHSGFGGHSGGGGASRGF